THKGGGVAMRFDELFRNLGYLAATFGSQTGDSPFDGVPVEELDLTGPPPQKISICGPARVELCEGTIFRVDVAPGPSGKDVLFGLAGDRLAVSGGDAETVVRLTLPAPRKLSTAGS